MDNNSLPHIRFFQNDRDYLKHSLDSTLKIIYSTDSISPHDKEIYLKALTEIIAGSFSHNFSVKARTCNQFRNLLEQMSLLLATNKSLNEKYRVDLREANINLMFFEDKVQTALKSLTGEDDKKEKDS